MLKKLGFIMAGLLMFTGCGSDHGIIVPLHTSATLKISVPTATPDRYIAGTAFTITLPTGITPSLKVDGTLADGVVTPSGTFAGTALNPTIMMTNFTPATGSTPASLNIVLTDTTSPTGILQGGEIATVVLKVSGFTTPSTSSFPFTLGLVYDTSLNPYVVVPTVSGLSLH